MLDETRYYPLFSTNSNPSISGLFEARKFFDEQTIPFILERYGIQLSDLYNENCFYGAVDFEGNVVLPININENFENIGSHQGKPILVQNFVAEAFIGFKEYLKNLAITGKISDSSPFFNISPVSIYEDLNNLYSINMTISANKFKNYVVNNKKVNSSIKDAKTFNKKYIDFLKRFIQLAPITKSETVLFYNLKSFSNGLTISLSNDDPGDDILKYDKYFLDDSFQCYAEACVRYGFKIDRHIPWIITADLNSPAWTKITSGHTGIYHKFNIPSSKYIFDTKYQKVYNQDLQSLKNAFYNSYLIFLEDNYIYEENQDNLCSADLVNLNLYDRSPVSAKEYFTLFSDEYWIKVYAYFRNIESKKSLTQTQFDGIVRESQRLVRYGSLQHAMRKLNDIFKTDRSKMFFSSAEQQKLEMVESIATSFTQPEIYI